MESAVGIRRLCIVDLLELFLSHPSQSSQLVNIFYSNAHVLPGFFPFDERRSACE